MGGVQGDSEVLVIQVEGLLMASEGRESERRAWVLRCLYRIKEEI